VSQTTEGESEGEFEEEFEDPEGDAGEIEDALDAVPVPTFADVYRFDQSGNVAALDRISPSQVNVEHFTRAYGGGKYRATFRGPAKNGSRRTVFRGNRIILVDPSIPPKSPSWANPEPEKPARDPSRDIEARRGGGHSDVLEAAYAGLIAIQQRMMESVMTMPRSEGLKIADVAALLEVIRPPAPASGAASSLTELLGAMKELRELTDSGGGKDDRNPIEAVITDLGPQLIEVLRESNAVETQRGRDAIHALEHLAASQRDPGPSVPTLPAPPNGAPVTTALLLDFLKPRVSDLLAVARLGANAEDYAEALLSMIPDQYDALVAVQLRAPGFSDALFQQFPQLGEVRPWVEALLAALRARFDNTPSPEDGND